MSKQVLVIGGGIAGTETAISLKKLGYDVLIVEKSDKLGGHLTQWDKLFPGNLPAREIVGRLIEESAGITVLLNRTISSVTESTEGYTIKISSGEEYSCSAIVVATGFNLFDARKKEEYGYGIYDRVITNADLESFFLKGEDKRITVPERVGFVHCVGSRDEKVCNRQCSKICCVTAVKQACEIKELWPSAEVFCFYMDLRMFGRGFEDLYYEAQSKYGVNFIRGRVSEVGEDENGRLVVKAEDTLTSRPLKVTLDLLVLMSGMVKNEDNVALSEQLGIQLGDDGFFFQPERMDNPVASASDRIFFAGSSTGPKTVPESVNEARAAALSVHMLLSKE